MSTETTETRRHDEPLEQDFSALSPDKALDIASEMIRSRERGLSGPSGGEMARQINSNLLIHSVGGEIAAWPAGAECADNIAETLNKFAERYKLELPEGTQKALGERFSHLARAAEYPSSATARKGLERLVTSVPSQEAEAYLSDTFITDLQLATGGQRDIQNEIPTFFSIYERLSRVSKDRNAYAGTIESVKRAAVIASDSRGYMENLLETSDVDSRFLQGLTSYNLLTLTTHSFSNPDTTLKKAYELFEEIAEKHPDAVEEVPAYVVTKLFRQGHGERVKALDTEKIEQAIARMSVALAEGDSAYMAGKRGGANEREVTERVRISAARYPFVSTSSARLRESARELPSQAFLATEYGKDFGRTLLGIAELIPADQQQLLFDKIHQINRYGAEFAEQFAGYDDKIVDEVRQAIGERITEILYVAKELAEDGGEASARVLGKRITISSMEEVMDALSLIEKGLERIAEADRSGIVTSSYSEGNREAYHLGTESDVLLQVKPRGERRGAYRKGVEHSEEAQINYSVDVQSDNGEYVPISISNHRRREALSIRIDLEGLIRDVNGGKIGFDATREHLVAALDIGSLRGAENNPNVRVARIVALGNKLRKRALGEGRSAGYHTALDLRYGDKSTFEDLAQFMSSKYRRRVSGQHSLTEPLDLSQHLSSASRSGKTAA